MLSLPLIPPQPDLLRIHHRPRPESPPPARHSNSEQAPHQQHRQPRSERDKSKNNNHDSPLALLNAAEAQIAQRKQTIRTFGSHWLRPPGIAKTLQAMQEEADEAAEQEELLRQEQGLRDMQARQMMEEAAARQTATAEGEGEPPAEGEVDLDAEIPDADASAGDDEDDEDDDVTFNDDSLVEGSHLQQEEAELTGAARDEEALGIIHEDVREVEEHNLDDSIPEAGSYQHTDTELEDDDSSEPDSDISDSVGAQSRRAFLRSIGVNDSGRSRHPQSGGSSGGRGVGRGIGRGNALHERMQRTGVMTTPGSAAGPNRGDAGLPRSPATVDLSSSLLMGGNESSFAGGSSPVMQRGRGRGAARRNRAGRMS